MKIAIISQPWEGALPPSSAIPIWTYQVARRLAKSHEVLVYARKKETQQTHEYDEGVHYILTKRTLDGWMLKVLNPLGRFFPARRPMFASLPYYFFYVVQVAQDLRKRQPDIVHLYNFPQFVSLLRVFLPRTRIVLHMQCDWLGQLDQAMLARHLAKADLILGVTEFITNNVRRRFPQIAERCQTVFNGVDFETFTSLNGRRPCPGPDPTDRPGKRLLFVGRLSPEKGIHILLEAFALVAQRYPQVHLDVVGPQWEAPSEFVVTLSDDEKVKGLARFYDGQGYFAHLQQRVTPEIADRVTFVGFVPAAEVVCSYQSADVFVFPSVWDEPFGMPVVEAMAAEVPVVATRSGGIVELIEHGTTGLLVNPDDAPALAEALVSLLENDQLCQEMGRAGRQRVDRLFRWERVVDSLEQHYTRLVSL
ncbi:MAG: glycosyltransferase family 4 protein [Chloroflexaceae bacterium]|nr:glycosyltransferase family 4 protein [Chloroflexaceae bacterium]